MLTAHLIDGTNILDVDYPGGLTNEDMVSVREQLERIIAEHGSARVLLRYGAMGKIEPSAIAEDLKTSALLDHIDKAAIVTDVAWVRTVSKAAALLMHPEVKTFTASEAADAVGWLNG